MKRILIKMSGESLANKEKGFAIDSKIVANMAEQLITISKMGIQVIIVIGGGNMWRGEIAARSGMHRGKADYIGMLATIMNGLSIQSVFEAKGLKSRVQSSLNIDRRVSENYVVENARIALDNNEILIVVGGTGRPFFTTDTAASLVASELKVDLILFAKNGIDGIYDSDPKVNENAKHFSSVSYDEILRLNLRVMDLTAVSMAKDNGLKFIVFNVKQKDALIKAITGDIKHTIVS